MAYWLNVLLRKSKAEGAGWPTISTGWAFAIVSGEFAAIACGSQDPALNPAVTLGVAIKTGDFSKINSVPGGADAGRYAGRVSGVAELLPTGAGRKISARSQPASQQCPRFKMFGANLLSETIGLFMLVLGVAAISSKEVAISGPAAGLWPYLAGVVVWVLSCLWAEPPVVRLLRPVTLDPA